MKAIARGLFVGLLLAAVAGPAAAAATDQARRPAPESTLDAQRLAIFIRGGCPYNLDKECHRNKRGKMVCRCVS